MTMPAVALFDIDGTLIDTGGAGARSWKHAFDKLYGIPADIGSHTSAGETDPVVARKTFGPHPDPVPVVGVGGGLSGHGGAGHPGA